MSLAIAALGATALVAGGRSTADVGIDGQERAGRERGIYVSVVNQNGDPVTDLSAREFIVREDGVAREVLMAEKAEDPITIALLVDNSQAATGVVADVRRALKAFVEKVGGKNPIAVTTFGERPAILQDYTLAVPDLARGVERIFAIPNSGAYLLQALKDIATGFGKRDFERGVIVAITMEGPEFSELNYDQVLPPLRQSGASLDVFVFPARSSPDPADPNARSRDVVLDDGPRGTGGRRVDLLTSMALDAALKKLAEQLTNEYRITYSRPETLIPPEKIEVSVKRPGLDARGTPLRSKRG